MDRMTIINKLKQLEEKKKDLMYLVTQSNSVYVDEINIDVDFVSKDFSYDGARMVTVNKSIFMDYLVKELTRIEAEIKKLIEMLVNG